MGKYLNYMSAQKELSLKEMFAEAGLPIAGKQFEDLKKKYPILKVGARRLGDKSVAIECNIRDAEKDVKGIVKANHSDYQIV